ncbi:acyltransferase [Pseudoalteromonas sp. T1lg88]|uniref:acyltransferase n=1 Tax=Pseudoalteromonas sp. T1lg88 TaxID=2077104 RepID=UPI000CF736EE|nr:acyltransferase [Pseudoalteromonas sp. T1lg88]
MKHKFALLYTWFVRLLLIWLPDQPEIMRFRGWLYSFAMIEAGKNFQVSSNVILRGLTKLKVGSDVYIAPNCILNCIDSVSLQDEVMLGFATVVVSGNHTKVDGSYRFGKSKLAPIVVHKGAWVGANVTIVAGAEVPPGCAVAAGACVSKKFTKGNVIAGLPAKIIR